MSVHHGAILVEAHQVLMRARALIADPMAWCQDSVARNKDGVKVNARAADAATFDLMGAIDRAGHDMRAHNRAREIALELAVKSASLTCGERSLVAANKDHLTVLHILDHATNWETKAA